MMGIIITINRNYFAVKIFSDCLAGSGCLPCLPRTLRIWYTGIFKSLFTRTRGCGHFMWQFSV